MDAAWLAIGGTIPERKLLELEGKLSSRYEKGISSSSVAYDRGRNK